MKKLLLCVMALSLLGLVLSACAAKPVTPADQAQTDAPAEAKPADDDAEEPDDHEDDEEPEEENYNTGDASLDNPRNQDDIGERELLVVSFGTSYNDSRRLTIGAIEAALEEAFPDWSVRRAFTSQIIIDHVRERDGEEIDNVQQALERAIANGVRQLVVQPTHLMSGYEYTDLERELAGYADAFESVSLGLPLLSMDVDYEAVADAMAEVMQPYEDGKTAIVLMGHGTGSSANFVYEHLQGFMDRKGMDNYYIGTVEAYPTVHHVLAAVAAGSYERVVLRPLMVVAGDHANNDMAGDDEDSWRSVFTTAEYQTECVLEGLGSLEAIQARYVEHARMAMGALGN
ncbi:MAG: sirohydrochlorin cobaltochelatase [Oscillospiraceae bacterium]|nr:sirohydrochlorin cobaltochelatase [Oscillospiraceae bacterium]